jgi:hypothetical protein
MSCTTWADVAVAVAVLSVLWIPLLGWVVVGVIRAIKGEFC